MNKKLVVVASALGLVVIIALGAAWWLGLFDEAEAEVSLAESAALVDAETATTDTESSGDPATTDDESAYPTTTQPGSSEPADDAATTTEATVIEVVENLTGTWQVVPSEATFVGYRVNEVLGGVGDFTAVGRTAVVTGELVGRDLTIESVSIVADLTQLASDNGARDAQMRRQGLETDTFPEAGFVLTEPIIVDALPAEGSTLTTTAGGELTLHGVTRAVQVAIEGQVVAGRLLVIGSTEIAMVDFDIDPPKAPVVASVDEVGIMEFSLVFARS